MCSELTGVRYIQVKLTRISYIGTFIQSSINTGFCSIQGPFIHVSNTIIANPQNYILRLDAPG